MTNAVWTLTDELEFLQPKTDVPMLAGTFVPDGNEAFLQAGVAAWMTGISKANIQLLWSQRTPRPLQDGSVWPHGIKPGVTLRNIGNISGDTASTVFRRMLLTDLEPGVPVHWELYPSIVGYMDILAVDEAPTQICILPGDELAYVACADSVVPIELHNRIIDPKNVRRASVPMPSPPLSLAPYAGSVAVALGDHIEVIGGPAIDVPATVVAAMPERGWLIAGDAVGHRLRAIDLTGELVFDIAAGCAPSRVACSPSIAWVTSTAEGLLTAIALPEGRVRGSMQIGDRPQGAAVIGDDVWVAVTGEGVCKKVDAAMRIVRTSEHTPNVSDVAVDVPDITVYYSTDEPESGGPHWGYFTEATGQIFDRPSMGATCGNIALTADSYIYVPLTSANQLDWWHGGTLHCRPENPFWCEFAEVIVEGGRRTEGD